MTYAINYQGLRKRETYDELVDFLLDKQPKIIYPDRRAKFIRNSPQLSNLLDGEGMGAIYWEEQQINRMKEEQKEHAIRQAGGTAQHLRAEPTIKNIPEHYSIADDDYDERRADFNDQLESVTSSEQEKEQKKEQDNVQKVQSHLSEVRDQQSGVLLGAEHLIKSSSSSSQSGNGDISSETFHSLPTTEQQQIYPFPYPSEQQSSSSPARDPTASSSTSRNPQEPKGKGRPKGSTNKPKSEASSSNTAYPDLEPPAAMTGLSAQQETLNKLYRMDKKELKEEFKRLIKKNPTSSQDNRKTLISMIYEWEHGEPSAPTLAEINKNKKKQTQSRRIDTLKPLRSPQ